jgi:hypothetical protein
MGGLEEIVLLTLQKPVAHMNKQIELVEVSPGTSADKPNTETMYHFTFRVTENTKVKKAITITLVDEKPYHLFHATLYEVATSPEELTSLTQLKESVALPFKEIFQNKKINFVQGRVEQVNIKNQYVTVAERRLPYDYLVVALGSVSNFYGIPGAKENSLVLQSVKDAFLIRNRLEFLVQMRRSTFVKENLRIIIAGGGLAGVEDKLCARQGCHACCFREPLVVADKNSKRSELCLIYTVSAVALFEVVLLVKALVLRNMDFVVRGEEFAFLINNDCGVVVLTVCALFVEWHNNYNPKLFCEF